MKQTDAWTRQNGETVKKKVKRKPKLNTPIPAFRERQDVDYFDKLPPTAQRYLKRFLDELYGRNFNANGLGKSKKNRKEVYHDTYAANNDMMHVLVRVDVDPGTIALEVQKVPGPEYVPSEKKEHEVERIYIEQGQKIVRYKTQPPKK